MYIRDTLFHNTEVTYTFSPMSDTTSKLYHFETFPAYPASTMESTQTSYSCTFPFHPCVSFLTHWPALSHFTVLNSFSLYYFSPGTSYFCSISYWTNLFSCKFSHWNTLHSLIVSIGKLYYFTMFLFGDYFLSYFAFKCFKSLLLLLHCLYSLTIFPLEHFFYFFSNFPSFNTTKSKNFQD